MNTHSDGLYGTLSTLYKRKTLVRLESATPAVDRPVAKVVLTIAGPPTNLGAIPKKKSSVAGRQKTPQVGQGPNREVKGPGGRKIP